MLRLPVLQPAHPVLLLLLVLSNPAARAAAPAAAPLAELAPVVERYCIDCHDTDIKKGGLSLAGLDYTHPAKDAKLFEKIAHKLNHRQMPPLGEDRPSDDTYAKSVTLLHTQLDALAAAQPNPGRTDTFRRLNRTEYRNAIRDLLAVDIDAAALLPNDESSHGFDNITVGNLSPALLDRYISAAQKIARLAVGAPRKVPGGDTIRIRPDITQEEHVEGLPLGTRGGALIPYTFPQDGEYEIQLRLARDRNEQVEGLRGPHDIEVLIDRARVAQFTVKPLEKDNQDAETIDAHLKFRVNVSAGPRQVGVTFPKKPSAVLETQRQPFIARFNMHRHPRNTPALYQVSITGPFKVTGSGDTPSRRKIFGDPAAAQTRAALSEDDQAKAILGRFMRLAYRRPVTDADLTRPLQFFRETKATDGFEAGIEAGLTAVLVSPQFLFRIESDPANVATGQAYAINDLELASRLSFFLWSSLPDDELLTLATRGELHRPEVLTAQTRRLLADPRADNLVTNFANQWLYLRNLEAFTPDLRLFPDFDDNLRQALKRETELFFESIMREDRSVKDFLQADYTYLNERLAKHYGIPHIYGQRFRRVDLGPDRQRGGLLRHGSVLTVTSYATRTSPVIRGHWILENLVGAPPPPPPPNIPTLDGNNVSASLPIRERLAKHRENPACASCHDVMDPVGFALENFNATGRWRSTEDGKAIDNSGGLPDGAKFNGVAGLEAGLAQRPELFAATLTHKLLTFALGRGVEYYDEPAIRQIVAQSSRENFRFSSLIVNLVNSSPFKMRKSP